MDREDPTGKEMETHSSILAWEIPQTEESNRLQSMGSQSQTRLSMHTHNTLGRDFPGGPGVRLCIQYTKPGFNPRLGN